MSDDKPCHACGGKGSSLDPDPDSRSYDLCGYCGGTGRAPGPAPLASEAPPPCIGRDPHCPCQDGDPCHYRDLGDTRAWPTPASEAQEEGDVEAVAKALHDNTGFRAPRWEAEAEGVRERCRIQAGAVLAVLRERGRLKEPEPVYPPFGQAMREMREEFGHLFTMPAQNDERSERPVTEAMIEAARAAFNAKPENATTHWFVNEDARMERAIAAALAAERP